MLVCYQQYHKMLQATLLSHLFLSLVPKVLIRLLLLLRIHHLNHQGDVLRISLTVERAMSPRHVHPDDGSSLRPVHPREPLAMSDVDPDGSQGLDELGASDVAGGAHRVRIFLMGW